jgi:hypothetical protein
MIPQGFQNKKAKARVCRATAFTFNLREIIKNEEFSTAKKSKKVLGECPILLFKNSDRFPK